MPPTRLRRTARSTASNLRAYLRACLSAPLPQGPCFEPLAKREMFAGSPAPFEPMPERAGAEV